MTNVYNVSNVSVRRGETTILKDVSLDVDAGTLLVLVGPNGAGKSTVLNLLSVDTPPDSGSIALHGRELSSYSNVELSRLRAVLPQQTLLQFGFRAHEVVEMGRQPLPPQGPNEERASIDAVMAKTDTLQLRDRVYPKLSGGEQSRVSFSRVLAQETPIILLDEPTASLDIRHQHDVMRIARGISSEGGTVIAILHDLNLALTYADRIAVLHHGNLEACGTPWEIIATGLLPDVFDCPLEIMRHPKGPQPVVVALG